MQSSIGNCAENKKETTPAKKMRYAEIDTLKGIAILLVVLGHSIIFYPINLHENRVCNWIFEWLSSVHMPLFFAVSGFCFSYKGNYTGYLWKKVRRIGIPYLVFNLIDMFPRTLFPQFVNRDRSIKDSLISIALYGGEYWFLYVLFGIFFIFPAIKKVCEKYKYMPAIIAVVIIVLNLLKIECSIFLLDKLILALLYFFGGYMVKKIWGYSVFKKKRASAVIVLILGLLVAWIFCVTLLGNEGYVVSSVLGILVCFFLTKYKIVNDIFSRFGKYSLQLYLFSGYFLVFSRTLVISVFKITNPLIIIIANMLVSFLGTYLFIKYVCEKIKIVREITGMM